MKNNLKIDNKNMNKKNNMIRIIKKKIQIYNQKKVIVIIRIIKKFLISFNNLTKMKTKIMIIIILMTNRLIIIQMKILV